MASTENTSTTSTTSLSITITPIKHLFATSPFSASSSPAVLLSTAPTIPPSSSLSPSPSSSTPSSPSPPPPRSMDFSMLPANSLPSQSPSTLSVSLPQLLPLITTSLSPSQSNSTPTPSLSTSSDVISGSDPKQDVTSATDPKQIVFVAETLLPTRKGAYRLLAFRDLRKSQRSEEIIVLVWGDVNGQKEVPLRVHDQCFTSEVLGSLKCDCREQLESAMDYIRDNERGLGCIIYLSQEGRGIGLLNKIRAYALQEAGYDTVDANTALGFADDLREYSCVPMLLSHHLQIQSVRLLTNNPRKMMLLQQLGVQVVDRIPIVIAPNPVNDYYHQTKKARMGHWI